jgi:8-oxo-dGTP diphosphatase
MERSIRNSAKALIIKDGKMLAVKLKDSEGEWYIMTS